MWDSILQVDILVLNLYIFGDLCLIFNGFPSSFALLLAHGNSVSERRLVQEACSKKKKKT